MVTGFSRLVSILAISAGVQAVRGQLIPFAYRNTTQAANATAGPASPTPSHGSDRKGPIVADGSPEMIPSRVDMRCRYAYLSDRLHYKLYRIFMASRGLRYDDWCETAERYIKARCSAEVNEENFKWVRCDPDGKDKLWEKGFIATFELHVGGSVLPQCVDEVLPETVPGSMVDWMWGAGCYEAYGFEMDY